MSIVFRAVLVSPPRTKKNHGRVVVRTKNGQTNRYHVSSEAHETWFNSVLPQVNVARSRAADKRIFPLTADVNCRALFFRHAEVGDAVGYYQALADLLESARVVRNDSQIRSWDGSRLLKDAARPRIEVELTLLEPERQMEFRLES